MARPKKENRLHIGLQRPVVEEHAKVLHVLIDEHLGNYPRIHRTPESPEDLHVTVLHIDRSPNIVPSHKHAITNNLPPSAFNRITSKLGEAAIFGSAQRWFAVFKLDSEELSTEIDQIAKLAAEQRERQKIPTKIISHELYPHLTVGVCIRSAIKPDVEFFKEAFERVREGVSRELGDEITLEPVQPINRQVTLAAAKASSNPLPQTQAPDSCPAKLSVVRTVKPGSIPTGFIQSIRQPKAS